MQGIMKQSEINNLSKEDLQDKLAEFQKQLEELKMTHAWYAVHAPDLRILQLEKTNRCKQIKATCPPKTRTNGDQWPTDTKK